jgi:hypothetical protein
MKFRNKLLIISLFIFILCFGVMLTSCEFLGFGSSTDEVAPTISNVSLLKTDLDYLTSKEYLYNKDSGNAMPLNSGDSFLISIEYENPSNYAISYVKINNQKIMAANFEEDSSKTNTIIKLTASEATSTTEESYVVNSIYYNTGSATNRLTFNDDYSMTFNVIIEPTFYLTLNYENADRRAATYMASQSSSKQSVTFNSELSNYSVMDKDYSLTIGLPVKEGGWVFEGYYTEPYGEGTLVSSTDKYYFWSDIVIYAYYSRIFTYEIVNLEDEIDTESILYTYTLDGKSYTKTFYNGVIITDDTGKGNPNLDMGDTIVDETVTKNEETGAYTVTSVEYPIIKIGNKAFQDVNTLVEIYIGQFVQEIGYYAFDNCNALENVSFSDSSTLKYIGDFAFQSTTYMGISYPLALPESVEYLGNFAFRYSGWKNTINDGSNESILHIKSNYKFIGTGCFFETHFQQVIFDAGCYFESQIDVDEADELEKADGWKEIDTTKNQIGANIFGNCYELISITLKTDTANNLEAVNIIPDRAFDAGNYTVKGLLVINLGEGLEFIGEEAFNYQINLTEVVLPASLLEVGKKAFYNCVSVITLEFSEGSELQVLHSAAFGNMSSISRVEILSTQFTRYGNGPFSGCGQLKSIEFINIVDESQVPMGFSEAEDPDEVYVGHTYSDLLYGTFESGDLEDSSDDDESPVTYSVPTRIFCNSEVISLFKENILAGKNLNAGSTSTSSRDYRDTIFVYDIQLICRDYTDKYNTTATDIALQEIYSASSDEVIGYSLAFWSARSKDINIPSSVELSIDGDTKDCVITEIGMYSMPTSVQEITIPSTVTRLEHDAFNSCTSLTTVNFEDKDTLVYIGENAFLGTSITEFEGGSSLSAIGQYAFWKCKALQWVDLSACTLITNNFDGRTGLKTQYKYDYEKTAIEDADTDNEDAVDYLNSLHYGVFAGCTSLIWIYLPPNINRMSRSLLTSCPNLETVIIENDSFPTTTSSVDEDECCFYENSSPTTVYDTTALAKGMTIYGYNIDDHRIIFPAGTYKAYDYIPDRP